MWGKRGKVIEEGLKAVASGIGEWKEREGRMLESVETWMSDVEKKVDREIGALVNGALSQNSSTMGLQREIAELRKEIERQQGVIATYRDTMEHLLKREDGLLDRLMARNLKELKQLTLPEVRVRGSEMEYELEQDENLTGEVLTGEEMEVLSGRKLEG